MFQCVWFRAWVASCALSFSLVGTECRAQPIPITPDAAKKFAKELKAPKAVVVPKDIQATEKEKANFIYWSKVCNILDAVDELKTGKVAGKTDKDVPRLVGSQVYAITAKRLKELSDDGVDDEVVDAVYDTVTTMKAIEKLFKRNESVNGSTLATLGDAAIDGVRAFVTANPFGVMSEEWTEYKERATELVKAQQKFDKALYFLERRYKSGYKFRKAVIR